MSAASSPRVSRPRRSSFGSTSELSEFSSHASFDGHMRSSDGSVVGSLSAASMSLSANSTSTDGSSSGPVFRRLLRLTRPLTLEQPAAQEIPENSLVPAGPGSVVSPRAPGPPCTWAEMTGAVPFRSEDGVRAVQAVAAHLHRCASLGTLCPIKDRWHRLRTYARCFTGDCLVDLMIVVGAAWDRADAVTLGQLMLDEGLIHHVALGGPTAKTTYLDRAVFYRFRIDSRSKHDSLNDVSDSWASLPPVHAPVSPQVSARLTSGPSASLDDIVHTTDSSTPAFDISASSSNINSLGSGPPYASSLSLSDASNISYAPASVVSSTSSSTANVMRTSSSSSSAQSTTVFSHGTPALVGHAAVVTATPTHSTATSVNAANKPTAASLVSAPSTSLATVSVTVRATSSAETRDSASSYLLPSSNVSAPTNASSSSSALSVSSAAARAPPTPPDVVIDPLADDRHYFASTQSIPAAVTSSSESGSRRWWKSHKGHGASEKRAAAAAAAAAATAATAASEESHSSSSVGRHTTSTPNSPALRASSDWEMTLKLVAGASKSRQIPSDILLSSADSTSFSGFSGNYSPNSSLSVGGDSASGASGGKSPHPKRLRAPAPLAMPRVVIASPSDLRRVESGVATTSDAEASSDSHASAPNSPSMQEPRLRNTSIRSASSSGSSRSSQQRYWSVDQFAVDTDHMRAWGEGVSDGFVFELIELDCFSYRRLFYGRPHRTFFADEHSGGPIVLTIRSVDKGDRLFIILRDSISTRAISVSSELLNTVLYQLPDTATSATANAAAAANAASAALVAPTSPLMSPTNDPHATTRSSSRGSGLGSSSTPLSPGRAALLQKASTTTNLASAGPSANVSPARTSSAQSSPWMLRHNQSASNNGATNNVPTTTVTPASGGRRSQSHAPVSGGPSTLKRDSISTVDGLGRSHQRDSTPSLVEPLDIDQQLTVDSSRGLLTAAMFLIAPHLHPDVLTECRSRAVSDQIVDFDESSISRTYKFGVVYVAPGQVTEEEFLSNCQPHTPTFDAFLSLLGTPINLTGFKGYQGGLLPLPGADTSIFTRFSQREIMFHVNTLLPYSKTDRQQVNRKKHIGNDIVCFVYLEDDTPFSPESIRSQFIHFFVVIRAHPQSSGSPARYTVTTLRRNIMPPSGPRPPKMEFEHGQMLRNFLLNKAINAEHAAHVVEKFADLKRRRRGLLLRMLARGFQPASVSSVRINLSQYCTGEREILPTQQPAQPRILTRGHIKAPLPSSPIESPTAKHRDARDSTSALSTTTTTTTTTAAHPTTGTILSTTATAGTTASSPTLPQPFVARRRSRSSGAATVAPLLATVESGTVLPMVDLTSATATAVDDSQAMRARQLKKGRRVTGDFHDSTAASSFSRDDDHRLRDTDIPYHDQQHGHLKHPVASHTLSSASTLAPQHEQHLPVSGRSSMASRWSGDSGDTEVDGYIDPPSMQVVLPMVLGDEHDNLHTPVGKTASGMSNVSNISNMSTMSGSSTGSGSLVIIVRGDSGRPRHRRRSTILAPSHQMTLPRVQQNPAASRTVSSDTMLPPISQVPDDLEADDESMAHTTKKSARRTLSNRPRHPNDDDDDDDVDFTSGEFIDAGAALPPLSLSPKRQVSHKHADFEMPLLSGDTVRSASRSDQLGQTRSDVEAVAFDESDESDESDDDEQAASRSMSTNHTALEMENQRLRNRIADLETAIVRLVVENQRLKQSASGASDLDLVDEHIV